MDLTEIRNYCIKKPGSTEDFPFDFDILVIRLSVKIYLLTDIKTVPLKINLKCDPDNALYLREHYKDKILPGHHMNKKHWNTVIIDGSIPENEIYKMIDESYSLVYKGLNRKQQEKINSGNNMETI
ncbi:MAG TPA: MmcQ/YjbR family DNA-binding protein [Spirochaetota bacterium]|nr:MmcQ/YjbR family DNA-binding protein [Spirochaetota bacterium]HOR44119.1 MmcQ/YjbR family DNA-binding protein [Spirochaetota bacterium]HOU85371.1 MmcQ/YjbR family DNA-binding protein [Spirochaetota bacterium]HPK57020.1 MmcQ/YjbR family DNA-binding protein [Spirochaetota bacterium]HQE59744.1 MmcQ/YjbR family DNA-binding protein [Spirochaetota bacterium]